MTPPSTAGTKPKPVATVPVRPALQKPEETANAMAQAERLALQSDLAWVGQYNGAITGEVSERMVDAIKEFQKSRGGKQTGVLNPQERGVLADTARRRQENVGWKIVTDPGTGVRLGIPTKLVPQQASDANGAKWTSPTGTVQIMLARRKEANPTTAKLAEQEKKETRRTVDYTVVKPDFFVLSGLQGLKKFYMRGTFKGDEVRILTILYDQADGKHRRAGGDRDVERVQCVPDRRAGRGPAAAQDRGIRHRHRRQRGRRDHHRPPDHRWLHRDHDCRLRQCRPHRRRQGARSRAAAHLRRARSEAAQPRRRGAKTALDLTGIADPQSQGGGGAVSSVKASVAQAAAQRSRAVAGARARFLRRGRARRRRQVRRASRC